MKLTNFLKTYFCNIQLVQDEMDFILPEDNDLNLQVIVQMDEEMRRRKMDRIPVVHIDPAAVQPRQVNSCDICHEGVKTHACMPCGHMCMCSNCSAGTYDHCPICNMDLNFITRIYI